MDTKNNSKKDLNEVVDEMFKSEKDKKFRTKKLKYAEYDVLQNQPYELMGPPSRQKKRFGEELTDLVNQLDL